MKIVQLTAENIKRVSAIQITPEGSLVTVGGKNEAGKSSVLDCIAMALGGAAVTCDKPVRRGQDKGKVVLDLGDIVVTRTFTATGGGGLIVANKDGARFPSPQAMLDKLIGRLSFDPLAFETMKEKEQADTLRATVGLDTADLDQQYQALYAERTVANRTLKAHEALTAALPHYPEAPAEEVSGAALAAELEAADVTRKAFERAKQAYAAATKDHETAAAAGVELQKTLNELLARVEAVRGELATRDGKTADTASAVQDAQQAGIAARAALIDPAPIRQRIADADAINVQVRANLDRGKALVDLDLEHVAAQAMTERLEAIELEKAARLAAVTFPVDGLSVDEHGATYNGLPFSQASQAVRLRVSVAMGLSLNPKLRVLLVREGSRLDNASLKLIAELAEQADAQVWVERVMESPDGKVSVFIEDGAVKDAESAHA